MSPILIALLVVDAILLVALVAYIFVGLFRKDKPVVEEKQAEEKPAVSAPVEEQPEKVEEVSEVEEPVSEVVEEVAAEADEPVEDVEDDRETARRVPFAEKMLYMDRKTQEYYDAINNKFISLRRINPRVSSKGVSYRLGRELVAKITVRGKTMKLHLALDTAAFEEKIYFQKNLSDVKAYAEVPFTVKVKSDRGLKNALKLIDALVEAKGIESKVRFNKADSIEDIKEIARKYR